MRGMQIVVVGAASLFMAGAAAADILYDFEEFDADGVFDGGVLTTLDYVKDGVTMTLTRTAGERFDLWDAMDFGAPVPDSWGRNNLSPFFGQTTDDRFIADFNGAVLSGFSYEFGDYGADFDDDVILEAYDGPNGTGTLIGSTTGTWGGDFSNGDDAGMLKVSVDGIRSVVFGGGSAGFPNSLFYDNLYAQGVPSPGAIALLGLAGLAGRRRRRA